MVGCKVVRPQKAIYLNKVSIRFEIWKERKKKKTEKERKIEKVCVCVCVLNMDIDGHHNRCENEKQ